MNHLSILYTGEQCSGVECTHLSDGQAEPYVPQTCDVNLGWAGMLTGWHGGGEQWSWTPVCGELLCSHLLCGASAGHFDVSYLWFPGCMHAAKGSFNYRSTQSNKCTSNVRYFCEFFKNSVAWPSMNHADVRGMLQPQKIGEDC